MLLESLESRRLFSVTVTEGYPGFYEICGDEHPNVIDVSVSMNDETFTLDGVTYTGVAYILVHGYGGDDTISVISTDGPGYITGVISAGDGNDTITLNFDGGVWAGAGDDTLYLSDAFYGEALGEAGDDRIYISGDCYDAQIDGGAGNDFIDCSGNNYRVFARGGAGNDTIIGSAYDDHLRGDEGDDTIIGGGGNDSILS